MKMQSSYVSIPLLSTLLLVVSLGRADVSTVSTVMATVTAAPAPVPTSTQYTNDTEFRNATLTAHNFYRSEHNATALVWNETSAKFAENWASKCSFEHTGGPTGENLAAGYANATASIDAWGTERSGYDFKKAEFIEAAGHFTQLVWKSSTSVGCGQWNCNGKDGTPGWYVVCEYYPPGNVIGAFAANVQEQISGIKDGTVEMGLGAATSLKVDLVWSVAVVAAAGWATWGMW